MSKKEENFYKSGNKKFDENDYQGAIDDFSKAIELDPQNVELEYTYRARAKFSLGDYQGAIDDYTKAIELDSENGELEYASRGRAKYFLKDFQEAKVFRPAFFFLKLKQHLLKQHRFS